LPSKVNGALGASLCANAMETEKTETDKKQRNSGIVFMFFPSFVLVYRRAGRSLCHQRKSISKWPELTIAPSCSTGSVKTKPFVWRPYSSDFISH
jgi:hypothetical protein